MKLIHFAREPFSGAVEPSEQHPGGAQKPRGLWVSDESQYNSWRWWCEGMDWYDRIAHAYAVTLADEARVLRLAPHDLEDFTREYGMPETWTDTPFIQRIDWRCAAQQWQGVVLTPYNREEALLSMTLMWAYSFDCASGCIWDPAAIASVEPVEIGVEP